MKRVTLSVVAGCVVVVIALLSLFWIDTLPASHVLRIVGFAIQGGMIAAVISGIIDVIWRE